MKSPAPNPDPAARLLARRSGGKGGSPAGIAHVFAPGSVDPAGLHVCRLGRPGLQAQPGRPLLRDFRRPHPDPREDGGPRHEAEAWHGVPHPAPPPLGGDSPLKEGQVEVSINGKKRGRSRRPHIPRVKRRAQPEQCRRDARHVLRLEFLHERRSHGSRPARPLSGRLPGRWPHASWTVTTFLGPR
jgi:hypothetical protein